MIDERLAAVRLVREEADRLRLACIELAVTPTLMHLAYDSSISPNLPADQAVLLGYLQGVSRDKTVLKK